MSLRALAPPNMSGGGAAYDLLSGDRVCECLGRGGGMSVR